MTVIAWDGQNLAWDSRVANCDRKYSIRKCRKLKDGRTIVVAGTLSSIVQAKGLLDGNGYPILPSSLTNSATIVVYDNGSVYVYDDMREARKAKSPDAWGSGAAYALGALSAGADAETACRIACKYSPTCGGKINSIRG